MMYINPFVAGILITLLVEFAFIIIFVAQHLHKIQEEEDSVNIELTEDEAKELADVLRGVIKHGENNDNQG